MSAAQVASGATTATLRYDPLGRLYETSGAAGAASTTRFLYDGDALVGEYNDGGTLLRRYVHGTGTDTPYTWYEGSAVSAATRRHLFANEQGSISLVTNGTGLTVLGKNAYDAYGIPKGAATATSADDNIGRFQFTGQIWLPELGMYYYKARMMSPTLGRFMQTDPIGYSDGMNWYNYVGSDPLNYVDPTGKGAECLGLHCNGAPGGGSTDDSDTLRKYRSEFNQALLASFGVEPDEENVIVVTARRRVQRPTPCQAAFLKGQLRSRGLPTRQIDNLKFVSGLDSRANALTRRSFKSGAAAVTQGSTVYVQSGSFDSVANFRSPTGFEEAYHTAQFASDSWFYTTYGILSIGGFLATGDSYNGNAYEAFAKGASRQMFEASKSGMCR